MPERLAAPQNLVVTDSQSFFVLTYCRMLHTLQTGTVQSKKAGMTWAKQIVAPKWVELIEQAWQEREGVRFMVKIHQRAEQTLLYETLDFMKNAVMLIDNIEVQETSIQKSSSRSIHPWG